MEGALTERNPAADVSTPTGVAHGGTAPMV
jgi:hypothetical protein